MILFNYGPEDEFPDVRIAIDTAIAQAGADGRVSLDAWWLRGVVDLIEDRPDEDTIRDEGFEAGVTEAKAEARSDLKDLLKLAEDTRGFKRPKSIEAGLDELIAQIRGLL